MKKTSRNGDGGFNIWQPTSDMMTGLLLIIMLVMLILGLLLLMPHTDDEYGDTTESSGEYTTQYEPNADYAEENSYNNSAAAGGGTDEGDYPEEGYKSAVLVKLIDADTDKPIEEEGVTFELYTEGGTLQSLNTYYPQKVTYKEYQTRADGTFYLPEKIWQGGYYLHQTSPITGYEDAADVHFTIDAWYDWSDPYVVEVRVHEYRSAVRIQLVDAETGQPVTGATFTVTSNQDINTEDGYKKGDVVDTITLDENGYGESRELYQGSYTISEDTVPQYYARITDDATYTIQKQSEETPTTLELTTTKTSFQVTLTDEATKEPIEGAEFTIRKDGGETVTETTDANGSISVTDLEKGAAYTITQTRTADGYQTGANEQTVTVSADGLIEGRTSKNVALTNRMIRVQLGVVDKILKRQVQGESVTLYDAGGASIDSWTTDAAAKEFTDLEPGSYYLVLGSDASTRYDFTVADTAAVQSFNLETITTAGWGVIAAAAAAVIAVIVVLIVLARKALRRRKEQQAAQKKDAEQKKEEEKKPDNAGQKKE